MSAPRDMTPAEAEARRYRSHERRAADDFECPYCGANSGMATSRADHTIVVKCHECEREFFAWAVPGLIHVTAKL